MTARIKNFDPRSWTLETALELKGTTTVSVCIPCRNEADTVGDLIRLIEPDLLGSLVDELIVLDDDSSDETAYIAEQAGARWSRFTRFTTPSDRVLAKGMLCGRVLRRAQVTSWCGSMVTSRVSRVTGSSSW